MITMPICLLASVTTLTVCAAAGSGALPQDIRQGIEADWAMQEKVARGLEADSRAAVEGAIQRGLAMTDDLGATTTLPAAQAAREELNSIAAEMKEMEAVPTGEAWLRLYLEVRWIVRGLAFANPALDFDELLFVKRNWPSINHQCSHRVGEAQAPPANLCVLKGLQGDGQVREILTGDMAAGGIGRPDLSFDGRRVVFPHAAPRRPATAYGYGVHGARGGSCYAYDICEVGIDGSNPRRLTDTPEIEDTEPCYLPGGRIAFTTSREGRYVQCGDWALVCGIFSMNADGSEVRKITEAQEGEFYPGMLADGRILYTRWDYIMKGYNVIQQLWTVNPDGTRAQLAYGDWYSFSPGPIGLYEARQIPGTNKVIATGAAHHNTGVGPVMIVDMDRNRLGASGMANVTPEIGYPECNAIPLDERSSKTACSPVISNVDSATGWCSSPYPLTESQYLACASYERSSTDPDGFAIYLMDIRGNKELVHRAAGFSCYSPIPVRPRPVPRSLSDTVSGVDPATPGRLVLYDVYQGLEGVKPGTIRYLRVMQAHPKLAHTVPQRLDFGLNSGWDQRSVLGTVPVEADGSAYFEAPPGKMIFFAALDENHLEVRRMRNYMNLMPGESASCVGCHESPDSVPSAASAKLLALRRAPSRIAPPGWGANEISFPKVIQPILERRCVTCHDGAPAKDHSFDLRASKWVQAPTGYDADEGPQHLVSPSFLKLLAYVSYIRVGGYHGEKLPLKPYASGSGASRLMEVLGKDHYATKLTPVEWQSMAAWIDCNAPYYGDWSEIATQGAFAIGTPVAVDKACATARRQALQLAAGAGSRVAAYLNCGLDEKDGPDTGPLITQTTGACYDFSCPTADVPRTQQVISFDPQALKFVLSGLTPGVSYKLGLTWWDYDAAGRVQSLIAKNRDAGKPLTLIDNAPLPSYVDRKLMPETKVVPLPADLINGGDLDLTIRRDKAANAVICEIWLIGS